MKQQRNESCSCGSGLKAKKCCILAEKIASAEKAKRAREYWERKITVARSTGKPSDLTNVWASLAAMGAARRY